MVWKELQEFCYVVVVIPCCCSCLLLEFTEKEKKNKSLRSSHLLCALRCDLGGVLQKYTELCPACLAGEVCARRWGCRFGVETQGGSLRVLKAGGVTC